MARNYILSGSLSTFIQETTANEFIVNGAFVNETQGGGAALSLVPDAGSYTFTGTNASLEFGREIAVDAGSYAVTGTDASLEHGWEVAVDAGSYSFTGTDATLTYVSNSLNLVPEPGSYSFTGTNATLINSTPAPASADNYYYAPSREAVRRMLDILYPKKRKRKENRAKRIERMAAELINEFEPGPDLPPLDLSALRNAIVMLDEPIRINRAAPDETRKQVIVKLYEKAAEIHRKNIEEDDEEVLEMALRAMLN
jgi:hypothetical protein